MSKLYFQILKSKRSKDAEVLQYISRKRSEVVAKENPTKHTRRLPLPKKGTFQQFPNSSNPQIMDIPPINLLQPHPRRLIFLFVIPFIFKLVTTTF